MITAKLFFRFKIWTMNTIIYLILSTTLFVSNPIQPTSAKGDEVIVQSDVCKIPAEEVASIFGWKGVTGPFPNSMNNEKRQACDYVGSGTSGRLMILQEQYEGRIVENKYVESAFDATLTDTRSDLSWDVIQGAPGDAAIYGYGKDGPNHTYMLKYRFGNQKMVTITHSGSKKRNPEETLEGLLTIARKLWEGEEVRKWGSEKMRRWEGEKVRGNGVLNSEW